MTLLALALLAGGIDVNAVRAHGKFLSDDLLEGRAPGSRGGAIAARYLASQLESYGYETSMQDVALVGLKAEPAPLSLGETPLRFGEEWVGFTGSQSADLDVDAELVFLGYGISAERYRWNDWKGDESQWRGKVLVMLVNDPFEGRTLTYEGRWTYKFEEAARRGALGVILVHTDASAGYGWNVVRRSNGAWRYDLADDPEPKLPLKAWVTEAAARSFLDLDALARKAESKDFSPIPLGKRARVRLKSEVTKLTAPNVTGVLRGSKLPGEYVVLTSHWDHLGVGEPDAEGDAIHNGALDNATGCAATLAIANALAKAARPKRSVIVLFTTAEEQGLLGAEAFVKKPPVPLGSIVANVNLDAMNVLGETDDVVGLGVERSDLGPMLAKIAKQRGMRVAPDPKPEQGSFFRSDNFPFAKAGIPSTRLSKGSAFRGRPAGWADSEFRAYNNARYHQPSDEWDDGWNLAGLVQEAEIAMALLRAAADAPARPKFNPGDPFARRAP